MPSTRIDEIKNKIIAFLVKHNSEEFKAVVLARRLSIKDNEGIQLLKQALNELHQAKLIKRGKRKRYSYATPPTSNRLIGTLSLSKQGNGIVHLQPPSEGVVQIPSRFLNTALEGDTVSVALFAQTGKSKKNQTDSLPEGEIIEIISRAQKSFVGTFQKSKHFYFVVPDDRRLSRDIYIAKGKTKGARPGERVVVNIESWVSKDLNPEGCVIEILGKSGELRAEMSAVAREFNLPMHFPKEVIQEAEQIKDQIPTEEYQNRKDLRNLLCFTIDPEDAKDFDDAVSLEILSNGNYLLGVHIADVSHYVKEGSQLDKEAFKRGTSVYLADEVIPMLPEKISNGICSLRPKEDRLTYSVFMTLSPIGILKDYEITKSIIHSKARFTYEEVQKIIETGKGNFASTIIAMHKLSQILLQKRMKEGGIDFESTEVKFRYDREGKPTEIIKKERLDSHRLIEEFMLMANQTVARHIGLRKKEDDIRPFIYRVHDPPPPEKLNDFVSFVEHLGYSLNITNGITAKALQKLLSSVKGKPEENVINEVAIRTMAKAIYSEKNTGHFGLGFKYYTHFTSPIRRYPDLVVHRYLFEYSNKRSHKRRVQLQNILPDICKQSTDMERIAMEAERASVKVMQVEYMKRHLGDQFDGIISGVTNFGLFVQITDLLVEGLIHIRDIPDDYFVFDEKNYVLTGKRTKKRYRLGDKVKVQVSRVDPIEREIDFILID